MTQEEIIDYNRRCAEFLGMYDYSKDNEYFEKGIYYSYPEKDRNPGCGYYTILQKTTNGYTGIFNSDWNWIMEVIQSIKNLGFKIAILSNDIITVNIYIDVLTKYESIETTCIIDVSSDNQKEAVVEAINQFLIKYSHKRLLE